MRSRKIKHIVIIGVSILIVYWIFNYLTENGRVIPIKISETFPHPEKEESIVLNFINYTITLRDGWHDKGIRSDHYGWTGKLKRGDTIFHYGYGSCCSEPTETLPEFLYQQRYDVVIMGDTIIVAKTDSTITLRYVWPIDPKTSDTLKTGILTDSLRRIYPAPHQLYKDCNYYSITEYNDSIYFVHIEVPDIILNSIVIDSIVGEYRYNIVKPKKAGVGITRFTAEDEESNSFSIWGYDLDYLKQKELIEAGFSVSFRETKPKFKQGPY